ncbi:hypothetical protein ABIC71_002306 [Herbaspirillum seropedicae]|uniref:hypothetical protein n=1 Tax=Herbaspirillum seropedicae TaxID=964 RepID=UPI0033940B94
MSADTAGFLLSAGLANFFQHPPPILRVSNTLAAGENFFPDCLSLSRLCQQGAPSSQHLSLRKQVTNNPSPADGDNDNDNEAKHVIPASPNSSGQGLLPLNLATSEAPSAVLAPLFGAGLWHRAPDHHEDAEFAMKRLKVVAARADRETDKSTGHTQWALRTK